jgi:hypothetical protein
MINQVQARILEMVVSGELTVEQADELLKRLDAQSGADAERQSDQRQRATGFSKYTGAEIAALKNYEVDADYVRALREAGFAELTVEQLIVLRQQ